MGQTLTTALSVGDWNMLSITRSGSSFNFYENAVYLGTSTSSLSIPYSGTPLTIGEAEGLGAFNGEEQNISIYDTTLTQNELTAIYNSSTTPAPGSVIVFLGGLAGRAIRRRRHGKR